MPRRRLSCNSIQVRLLERVSSVSLEKVRRQACATARTEIRTAMEEGDKRYFCSSVPTKSDETSPPNMTQGPQSTWNWDVATRCLRCDLATSNAYKEWRFPARANGSMGRDTRTILTPRGWMDGTSVSSVARIDTQQKHRLLVFFFWYAENAFQWSFDDTRTPTPETPVRLNLNYSAAKVLRRMRPRSPGNRPSAKVPRSRAVWYVKLSRKTMRERRG